LGSVTLEATLGVYLASLLAAVLALIFCLCLSLPGKLRNRIAAADCDQVPDLQAILQVCLPLLLIQLLSFVAIKADVWIAGACVADNEVAYYAAARRLMLLVAMPLQMASATIVPSIAELHAEQKLGQLQRMLQLAAATAVLPAVFALLALLMAGA